MEDSFHIIDDYGMDYSQFWQHLRPQLPRSFILQTARKRRQIENFTPVEFTNTQALYNAAQVYREKT